MKYLSEGESRVIEALWTKKTISTREIGSFLYEKFGVRYARTTIVTFLERINKKGFCIYEKVGRETYWTATISKEDYCREEIKHFMYLHLLSEEELFRIITKN